MQGSIGVVRFVEISSDTVSPWHLRSLHDPDQLVATPVGTVGWLAVVAVGRLAAVAGVVHWPGTAVRFSQLDLVRMDPALSPPAGMEPPESGVLHPAGSS